MAKKSAEKAPAAVPATPENKFIELMMVAAEFSKACGGIDSGKKSLEEAGKFIARAGSVDAAIKALDVLANLKSKIAE